MLVTDTTWAETHPVRRAVARPYQAWRCVAWTETTPNFVVVPEGNRWDCEDWPDGWIVAGPETLQQVVARLEGHPFSVYVMDRAVAGGAAPFIQVTSLWREREQMGGIAWFWYGTATGELKPCSRAQLYPEVQPDLVREWVFEGSVGDLPANV